MDMCYEKKKILNKTGVSKSSCSEETYGIGKSISAVNYGDKDCADDNLSKGSYY